MFSSIQHLVLMRTYAAAGHPVISRQPNFFILALFLRQSPLETLCNFFPLTHVAFSPARSRDFPRTFLTFLLPWWGAAGQSAPAEDGSHLSDQPRLQPLGRIGWGSMDSFCMLEHLHNVLLTRR